MEALRVPLTKCKSKRAKEAVCCKIQSNIKIMKQKHKKQKEEADYEEYALHFILYQNTMTTRKMKIFTIMSIQNTKT